MITLIFSDWPGNLLAILVLFFFFNIFVVVVDHF